MNRVSKVWTDVQTREWPGVSIVDGEVANGLDYTGTPVVSCDYDKLGRIYSATIHSDTTTSSTYSCSYNANGQVTLVTYPSSIAPSEYGYDSVGNLIYVKGGPESTYFTAKYDFLDRVTDVYLTGSSTLPDPLPSGTGDIRVAYEGASDLVTNVWRGAEKHVTYSYDMFGHMKTYKPTSGPISGVNLWYDYNALGQKKQVKILDASGATFHDTTYDYGRNGLLQAINYDGQKVAEYSYDPVGLVAQIDRYNGGSATGAYDVYSYDDSDPRNLLKTITMHYKDAGGQPISSVIDYTDGNGHPNVDRAGNQLSMTNLAGHWTYTYDHGGRVASITPPNPVPEQGVGGVYGYNWLGQLINPPAEPNHMTYNAAGLPALWPGMYSYTYKANGLPCQVKDPSGALTLTTLTYDAAGFPSQFSGGGITAECSWDADGGLLGYAETAGGTETESVLADPTASAQSVLMDNVSGSTLSYVCDPQGCMVATVSSEGQKDYHSDADGSFAVSTGINGAVEATYAYGADGDLVATTDAVGSRVDLLSIGQPPWYIGIIPVIGSGWSAVDDFQNGRYLSGTINAALAVSDAFMVSSAWNSVRKLGVSGLVKLGGSHTWNATRKYLLKEGFAEARVPLHHWLFHQGEGLGKYLPRWLVNQPWNLVSMKNELHIAYHAGRLSPVRAFMVGKPLWFRNGLLQTGLRVGRILEHPEPEDPCD